ncbi:guanylyl cyclase 1 isoform X1 [Argentina anserina]|uniref:guanylyl cyclase 1 isoform X1 n=2 Tax=Argentina anserina TaxID=57926 RepID=UPI0021762F6D|nr:guanylyl cyclase 1 isoform X1 [Potentilla anserina]
MWPSYLLFNKREDAEESDEEKSDLIESYRYEQSPRDVKCRLSALPCSHFVEVPHINQLHSWDCGLACVLMVFRTFGIDSCDIQTLADLCCTNSIWTVDLAYLLQKFSIDFSYYTVTFGANPNYSGETFYKEQLPNDLVRVDTLFQKALEAGIRIKCRSVSREEICFLILCGKYIAIVLVDQYKLSPFNQDNVIISDLCGSNSDYTGHYVIVCGYDTATDEFEIRDPACSRKHERVSSTCLEEARKSFGTDEDLLLISLRKSRKPDSPSIQLSRNDNVNS